MTLLMNFTDTSRINYNTHSF